MTVPSTNNKISYNTNGSQTIFPYNFKIFNDEDLTVILRGANGAETTLALTTDYTVSGAGEESGGNVTTVQTYASGNTLVIVRELDLTQETDYQEGGSFPAEAHENVVDRLTMIAQQLLEQLGRAIKLPISSQYSDLKIPDPEANKALVWNGAGTALENAIVTTIMGASTDLSDFPSVLIANKILRVKSDGSGWELVDLMKVINYTFYEGGAVLSTGAKDAIEIPFDCTIQQVSLIAPNESGDMVVDIWKDSYANFPPTVADTITASAKPTLSSAQTSQDSSLTGWTKSISAGDWLRFNIDSIATITRATLSIKVSVP